MILKRNSKQNSPVFMEEDRDGVRLYCPAEWLNIHYVFFYISACKRNIQDLKKNKLVIMDISNGTKLTLEKLKKVWKAKIEIKIHKPVRECEKGNKWVLLRASEGGYVIYPKYIEISDIEIQKIINYLTTICVRKILEK